MKCIVKKVLLKQIDQVLERVIKALEDNKLTEDELDEIKAKIDKIIAEW